MTTQLSVPDSFAPFSSALLASAAYESRMKFPIDLKGKPTFDRNSSLERTHMLIQKERKQLIGSQDENTIL